MVRYATTISAFALVFAGCMTPAINQAAAKAQAKADQLLRDKTAARACSNPQRVDTRCGLITNILASDAYRERFKAEQCGKLDEAACEDRYSRMVRARLELRYTEADFAQVVRVCDAQPGSCDSLPTFEERILESHNRSVQSEVAAVKGDIEQQRRWAVKADINNSLVATDVALHVIGEASRKR